MFKHVRDEWFLKLVSIDFEINIFIEFEYQNNIWLGNLNIFIDNGF